MADDYYMGKNQELTTFETFLACCFIVVPSGVGLVIWWFNR